MTKNTINKRLEHCKDGEIKQHFETQSPAKFNSRAPTTKYMSC